ncbi:hypothetical protein L5876_00005, partial [Hyphobacterium sp. SN044]|uniref:hypothetical protein n=1 Tax=Hyphobacterium sp. SN044 TaxID=2912575 RepID=UPI001F36F262
MFAAIALPLGLITGVFAFGIAPVQSVLIVALVAVFVPAIGEEIVFRVLLQGKPSFRRTPESSGAAVLDPGFRVVSREIVEALSGAFVIETSQAGLVVVSDEVEDVAVSLLVGV